MYVCVCVCVKHTILFQEPPSLDRCWPHYAAPRARPSHRLSQSSHPRPGQKAKKNIQRLAKSKMKHETVGFRAFSEL